MSGRSDSRFIIRVYGDSLGMPRATRGISVEMTYAEIVRRWIADTSLYEHVHLYNRSQGGTFIEPLFKEFIMDSTYFGNAHPSILIIQCGVVDCAPRPIPLWLRNLIAKLPGRVVVRIKKFLHNNRAKMLNMGLSWRYTPPRSFYSNYVMWLKKAAQNFTRVYLCSILPPSEQIGCHSPGFLLNVIRYNELIKKAVRSVNAENIFLIDVFDRVKKDSAGIEKYVLAEDGHHLSVDGHKLYADMIIENEKFYIKEARCDKEPAMNEQAI
jgi:hypothetical protein